MEREDNLFSPEKKGDPNGYNESEMDLDIEIRAGEWQSVKKLTKGKTVVPPETFLSTYNSVSSKLTALVAQYYQVMHTNPHQAQIIKIKLQKLRHAQEILLSYLLWEPSQEFHPDVLPPETWALLK